MFRRRKKKGTGAGKAGARVRRALAAGAGLVILLGESGCHRSWYRVNADKESARLIEQKATDPRWAYPHFSAYMDPRSRFFDPTNPDHSPMPQDDPFSQEYMRCVYGMHGARKWFKDGVRTGIENPDWQKYLGDFVETTPDHHYLLTLDAAVKLAFVNSPRYQSAVEEVYLTALDLAFERFRFDVQFFGGIDSLWTHTGKDADVPAAGGRGVTIAPPRDGGDSNVLGGDSGLTAHKLFPTGAELVVGFANAFMFQFAGPDQAQTISLLNFSIIQPLLRLGGRDVVLERLTRVERGLLANLRALTRYQQTFYVQTAIGEEATGAPQRAGGFLGGAGLDAGFTGTGVGGFGGAGDVTGFGRVGGTLATLTATGANGSGFAGGGAGVTGGFIGLAQLQQELRNREASVAHILRELQRMEANFKAGRIDAFQVDQFRESVQTQLSLLLEARKQFQTQVDIYLVSLGLPPDLPVLVCDPVIKQFEFFDPDLTAAEEQATELLKKLRAEPSPTPATLEAVFPEAGALQERVAGQLQTVREAFARFDGVRGDRLREMASEDERHDYLEDIEKIKADLARLEEEIARGAGKLQASKDLLPAAGVEKAAAGLEEVIDALGDQATSLSLVLARIRLESIVIDPVDMLPEEAFCIAGDFRLDWMNQRAAVVDQWRLIDFNANRLRGDLNIVLNGDMSTRLNNPLDFRGQLSHLNAGFQFEAPLARKAERNEYREALINFQAVRRAYIQYEDGVYASLRLQLRTLQEARANLELQRKSLVIAMRAFNLGRLRLRQPPPPADPAQGGAAGQFGPTTARDLLGALSDLLSTQNNFMSVWVQYETTRMQLYRDLGILQVDKNGAWIEQPLEPYVQPIRCRTLAGAPPVPAPEAAPAGERAGPDVPDEPVLPSPRPVTPGPGALPPVPSRPSPRPVAPAADPDHSVQLLHADPAHS